MVSFNLDMAQTLGLSVAVLLLGRFLVQNIGFLNKFCIPSPVVGGLLFSLVTLVGHQTQTFSVALEGGLQSLFMIAFFTTVGFGASIAILKKGGIAVMIFLVTAGALCLIQNLVGVGIAKAFGESPAIGLLAGSISMTGGHGTAGAFGPEIAKHFNFPQATTVGVAAATFGLIAGSLMGGPTARLLIVRNKLENPNTAKVADDTHPKEPDVMLDTKHLSNAFFQISIAVGLGSIVSLLIKKTGLTVPAYIGSMLVAALMRNVLADGSKYHIRIKEVQALGDIFLSVFLAQALMRLKLWELADLALPLTSILIAQAALMFLYAYFVTFRVMGKDYDAAVLSAGHCGFGLGATPNAVANMTAVVGRFGMSPKAFFVLPLVGGLFIDFVNATIITTFMNIL